MCWFIRAGGLFNMAAYKINQHTQSAGRNAGQYYCYFIKGFSNAGHNSLPGCFYGSMVGYACLAAKFCLQGAIVFLDISVSWLNCIFYRYRYYQLPRNSISIHQSDKKFKTRIEDNKLFRILFWYTRKNY